jgi:hypothetical protein
MIRVCEQEGIPHVVELTTAAGPAFRWNDADSGEVHEVSGTIDAPILPYDDIVEIALLPIETTRARIVEWVDVVEQGRAIAQAPFSVPGGLIDEIRAARQPATGRGLL